ncbi:MAG: urea carboxylase-associated family protein [Rhodospirillaceae bacterium]|nr:urea carboxylase-associated family protein [Rhodospirillaceae bacterium]MBT5512927.1 urea carboxylase-associated family protein [Rhodospirillaceae bacterium]
MTEQIEIPARGGMAAKLNAGQSVKVINTHGNQVVDTWAFNSGDMDECMSMEATRVQVQKLMLAVGDSYVTNHRRSILSVTEDTSPGIHDTLMAACDTHRYAILGADDHDNCTDNLAAALSELGLQSSKTPSPLNLFMNIPWTPEGALSYEPPESRAGDFITLRAEMDCVVVFSACPQDLVPVNGALCEPVEAHFEVA